MEYKQCHHIFHFSRYTYLPETLLAAESKILHMSTPLLQDYL